METYPGYLKKLLKQEDVKSTSYWRKL